MCWRSALGNLVCFKKSTKNQLVNRSWDKRGESVNVWLKQMVGIWWVCAPLFCLSDIGESLRSRKFLKGGPRSTYPRNGSLTCHLALSPLSLLPHKILEIGIFSSGRAPKTLNLARLETTEGLQPTFKTILCKVMPGVFELLLPFYHLYQACSGCGWYISPSGFPKDMHIFRATYLSDSWKLKLAKQKVEGIPTWVRFQHNEICTGGIPSLL